MDTKTIRCTTCSTEFTEDELKDAIACPSCGSKGVPCAIKDDVILKINWHELRILTIWADNYAREHLDARDRKVLVNIFQRLQTQFPDKAPLTIMGEVKGLQDAGYDVEMKDGMGNTVPTGPKRGKA